MRRAALFLSLLLSTPSLKAAAQEHLSVRPGDRVRVTAPGSIGGKLVASLLSLQSDTLRLQRGQDEAPLLIPVASVTRFEVSRGQRSMWALGLGIGFLGGAVVGAVVGSQSAASWDLPTSQATALGAGLFGVPSALVGLVVGAATRKDRWDELPAQRLRVTLLPSLDGRAGLRLCFTFS